MLGGRLFSPTRRSSLPIRQYRATTPATGSGDTGTVALDILNYWRKTGIGQHTIQADAALESGNHVHIRATVYLFGGCYVGLALPKTAREHLVWSASPEGTTGNAAPNWWGGHAVPVVAYSPEGLTDGRDMGRAPADDLGLLGYLLR
jgi:hypothetical protein